MYPWVTGKEALVFAPVDESRSRNGDELMNSFVEK